MFIPNQIQELMVALVLCIHYISGRNSTATRAGIVRKQLIGLQYEVRSSYVWLLRQVQLSLLCFILTRVRHVHVHRLILTVA